QYYTQTPRQSRRVLPLPSRPWICAKGTVDGRPQTAQAEIDRHQDADGETRSGTVAANVQDSGFHRMSERGKSNYPRQTCLPLRSEEHTSELQSRENLVCRLLLE